MNLIEKWKYTGRVGMGEESVKIQNLYMGFSKTLK